MVKRDGKRVLEAIDYALQLMYEDSRGLPEPNAELAEMAMSVIIGILTGHDVPIQLSLRAFKAALEADPDYWPGGETPSSRTN